MQRNFRVLAAVALAVTGLGPASRAAADGKPLLQLTAFAVNTNTPRARTGRVDIGIERWSTPEEIQRFKAILAEKGSDSLLSALQDVKPRVGYIRTDNSLGWDLRFATQVGSAGGTRRIIIGTDRPMSFWEAANQPRSTQYPFTVAEIRIGADGKGEGKLVPAAMVEYSGENNTLQIENYNTQPVMLSEVRVEK